MGKGDRRTRRGKIFRGTFGKSRKHKGEPIAIPVKSVPKAAAAPVEAKPEAPKKKRAPKKKAE
jgi:30S ribosomal protein S31